MRAWMAMLLLAGCRTPPFVLGDGGAPAPDAAMAGACVTHQLQDAPITSIEPVDSALPSINTTMRVKLRIPLAPCDVLGPIDAVRTIGDATDGVELRARVWRGTCDGARADTFVARAFGSPQNARVFFHDRNSDATLTIEPFIDVITSCTPAGPGNACTADCQCTAQPNAGCVLDMPLGGCLQTCNSGVECVDPLRPGCVPPFPSGGGALCASGSGCGLCPFPARCNGDRCVPPPAADATRCACQRDCAATQLCDATRGQCVTPCSNDRMCSGVACVGGACGPIN
jgi:hypothetical protein